MTANVIQFPRPQVTRNKVTGAELLPIEPVLRRIVGEFRNGSSVDRLGKKYEGIGRPGVEGCLRYALNEAHQVVVAIRKAA